MVAVMTKAEGLGDVTLNVAGEVVPFVGLAGWPLIVNVVVTPCPVPPDQDAVNPLTETLDVLTFVMGVGGTVGAAGAAGAAGTAGAVGAVGAVGSGGIGFGFKMGLGTTGTVGAVGIVGTVGATGSLAPTFIGLDVPLTLANGLPKGVAVTVTVVVKGSVRVRVRVVGLVPRLLAMMPLESE